MISAPVVVLVVVPVALVELAAEEKPRPTHWIYVVPDGITPERSRLVEPPYHSRTGLSSTKPPRTQPKPLQSIERMLLIELDLTADGITLLERSENVVPSLEATQAV